MSHIKLIFKDSLIFKIFGVWMVSLLIPILLFFLFLFIQYGDNIMTLFKGDFDFWQRSGYMHIEKISRVINVWALDTPTFDDHPELDAELGDIIVDKSDHLLLLERKGDTFRSLIELSSEDLESIIEDFEDVNIKMLPEFGERDVDSNEELLEKTGYVLFRQIDFYYADGSEGSVYLFFRYTNLPYQIVRVLGDNLMLVMVSMMLLNGVIAFMMIRKSTKPLNQLKHAMAAYKRDDFSVRLDETVKHRFIYVVNSAVNEMASELENNQKKKQALEEMRNEFIARITHDTKTPLASIRAHAEAIRDGLVLEDDKRIRYSSNILNKVQSLDHMINELSLYSDLSLGQNQYTFVPVDLEGYLKDLVDELKYDFDESKVMLTYDLSQSDHLIHLDVHKFHRVMMNLIGNADKYGDRDKVNVHIELSYTDTSAVIVVEDNGVGVDMDDPNQLLHIFVRGDQSRDPNRPGSGLGLTIVNSIVEKHEGRIELYTEYQRYFKVVIKLPLKGGYFETDSNY